MMYRTLLTTTFRTSAALSTRSFSTSRLARKSATEKVSEVAEKMSKSVGKGLASAIETGEQATQKTKEGFGAAKSEAGDKADKMGDIAGQKANKAGAEAKATKEEMKDAVRK